MKLLLDTHMFMWFVEGDVKLHAHARSLIEDPGHERWLSTASLWEMAIKASLGKLEVSMSFQEIVRRQVTANDISLLRIEPSHLDQLRQLPFPHRDPFDRLLIAQAIVEDAVIVGRDPAFDAYPVRRVWSGT